MRREEHMRCVKACLADHSLRGGQFEPGHVVTLFELVERCGLERTPVRRCCNRLVQDGWLRVVDARTVTAKALGETYGPRHLNPTYLIIADIRQRRDYQARHVTCRDKIWSTLRARRRATRGELAMLTGCGHPTVQEYTKLLRRGGFIKPAGKQGRETLWVLVRDPGPGRPDTPGHAPTTGGPR